MLEKIRNQAGLLVVVIGIALAAFILGDLLNSGSSYIRGSADEVASVDGETIHYMDYQSRVDELIDMYKMQMRSTTLPDEYISQAQEDVYGSMVQEIVLENDLPKIGINVTSEELFNMVNGEYIPPIVQQMPLFINPNTGQFDKTIALNVLKTIENIDQVPDESKAEVLSARSMWLFWERNMKMQRFQEKYSNILAKAVVANPLDAKDAFEGSAETSDLVLVSKAYNTVDDAEVKVTESDIKKMYDERKESFKQKETRIVEYVSADILPSQEDYLATEQTVKEYKAEMEHTNDISSIMISSEVPYVDAYISEATLDSRLASFLTTASIGDVQGPLFDDNRFSVLKLVDKKVGPDSLKISRIFVAAQRGEEAVKFRVDSLMNELKSGVNFADVARSSSDENTQETGGDLGWVTEIALAQDVNFKDAIFKGQLNQPFLYESPEGTQIIKITESTPSVAKYKFAYMLISLTPSSKTQGKIYSDLNQFITVNNTKEKREAAAKEAGYSLKADVEVTAADRTLQTVPDSRQVVRWIFQDAKKGIPSEIFDCKEKFIVAILEDVQPEGYRPLASVEQMLKNDLTRIKKGEMLVDKLKAKNLNSLDAYAKDLESSIDTISFVTFNTTRINKIGIDPIMNAEITYSPLNKLSEPIAGKNAVYVFDVTNRTKNEAVYNEAEQIRALSASNAYRATYQAMQHLIDKAKIKDNRVKFN